MCEFNKKNYSKLYQVTETWITRNWLQTYNCYFIYLTTFTKAIGAKNFGAGYQ